MKARSKGTSRKEKSGAARSKARVGRVGRSSTGAQSSSKSVLRYAVVGLGYISQVAMLPAFAHARSNSRLAALISDDPTKLKTLSRKYKVPATYSYDEYEACLRSGGIDAVYIALPNSMHASYAIRAAEAGVHVLCEKPMAVTEQECEAMIAAAKAHDVT